MINLPPNRVLFKKMAKGLLLMNFIIGLPLFLTRAKMKDSSSLIVSGSFTLPGDFNAT